MQQLQPHPARSERPERTQSEGALPAKPSWEGQLALRFSRRGSRTEIAQQYAQAPLRLQRPFYPEASASGADASGADVSGAEQAEPGFCQTVVVHTAGGMVGGDRLSYDITLESQARVLLTTAAASKIYRSTGPEASQQLCLTLQPGARLEWLPQDTIVFRGARYRQDMRIELAPGATWLGGEITRLGRTAMGERFDAGSWRSRTEVWQLGRPLWIDRQWLPGLAEVWNSPHGLAGCPVVGSLVRVGREVSPTQIEQLRSLWQEPASAGEIGVTRLPLGLVCRYRGHSSSAVRRWFVAIWRQLRMEDSTATTATVASLPLRVPPVPRVWQIL